jgi:hypothetical protein
MSHARESQLHLYILHCTPNYPDTASLNVSGTNFFLNGTWNVNQVTTNFTITTDSSGAVTNVNRNQNIVPIETGAYGELEISSDARNFTLTITGVDDLAGGVHVQRITTRVFNPFIINNVDGQTTVTKQDLTSIISAYGSSPGWGKYDNAWITTLTTKLTYAT